MYENETYEVILRRMLARVSNKLDKREGSIIFDALAPAGVEIQNFFISLDGVLNEVFVDTASREYLIKHCAERGITPKLATYAIVQGVFTPASIELPIGARFSHEDYNYSVLEKVEAGVYNLQCEMVGAEPNGATGQLIPIDYIRGLETAEIVEVIVPGEDEESTESLRARYMMSLNSESFAGNKISYEYTILSMAGVGGVKVYSGAEWNGGGTVKCVIADSNNGVPSEELIERVQTAIDPLGNQGDGIGLAPIGHFVTICGVNETVINISTNLVLEGGLNWLSIKGAVEEAIDSYISKLNENWGSRDKNFNYYDTVVRINQIENVIFTVQGIVDVYDTKINGKAENLTVNKDSIVKRGTITNA